MGACIFYSVCDFITGLFNLKEILSNVRHKEKTFKNKSLPPLSLFQPAVLQIDSMSGSSRGEKFTNEKRRNMAFLGELTERKRRQLDKSARRR